jgi:MFS family permease
VPRVVHHHEVERGAVEAWRAPREDLLVEAPPEEQADGSLRFAMATGPFHEWERQVAIDDPAPGSPTLTVTETVAYRLAVPVWGPLFSFALRGRLRRGVPPTAPAPWWAPSQVLDARAATVLSLLCLLGAVAGYLGTLITQTVTFAARQFDASTTDQGTLLASVRIGVLLSLVIVATADRRGRAVVLRVALLGGCLVTALGALAPGMVWLGTTQTFARALSTVAALLIAIIAVEEMPAGARAFAVSVLAMTAALGAGICVVNVAYADLAEGAWRGAYLLPLLLALPVWRMARRLPETHRFERHRLAPGGPHHQPTGPTEAEIEPETAGCVPPDGAPAEESAASASAPFAVAGSSPSTSTSTSTSAWTSTTGSAVPAMGVAGSAGGTRRRRLDLDWGRFALLAGSGFLWSIFLAPAAQFLNEFLRAERGFSGLQITLFVLATNTPGGLGIVLGGRLADRRGRRLLAIIGIAGGVGFTVVSYLTWGWPLWASSIVAAIVGSVAIPAMGVYGPELFPTGQRGLANGGLQVVSVAGSSAGLLLAGWLGDRFDSLGPAMAVLAVGPMVLIVLVAAFYPETARRELEDLNPSDR